MLFISLNKLQNLSRNIIFKRDFYVILIIYVVVTRVTLFTIYIKWEQN